MKKFFSLLFIFMFLISNIHASEIEEDPFDDCLEEAEIDYSITGSMESAIEVYNQCVDETLEQMEQEYP